MCLYPLYTTFLFLFLCNFIHTIFIQAYMYLYMIIEEEYRLVKRREIIIICTKYLITWYDMI